MKRKKILAATIIGAVAFFLFVSRIGFYLDREWYDLYIFIKHKNTLKMVFYAPRGEADYSPIPGKEGFLMPDKEKEENLYIEFVENQQAFRRSVFLPIPVSWLFHESSD